ncbi:hypothetical protein HYH02_013285 [Chlamydomonas schloesseri]|uniref:Uncharacterized protein n=1 Tax=Chlamydomonas schloesseri TaxID=2026947 RepID=A0A835VW54_9CHLO|nr:hypothetical protein HYH02_013285 [Chlamydomonas schloesseri]|eukprot:KAG2431592.1 hypothetical protein HYH02_013285 [Chlamydomonas schloesseri]
MTDADFAGYQSVIARSSDLEITGGDIFNRTVFPVLSWGNLKSKVRLDDGARLTFRHVVLRDFTASLQSGTLSLLAPSLSDSGSVVTLQESLMQLGVCIPPSIRAASISSVPRPPGLPGTQQVRVGLSQEGCTNTSTSTNTTVPLALRCWADVGELVDVAVAGVSPPDLRAGSSSSSSSSSSSGTTGQSAIVPLRYAMHLLHVTYLCEQVVSRDCIDRLGLVACMVLAASTPPPPPLPPPAASPDRTPVVPAPSSSPMPCPAVPAGGGSGGPPSVVAVSTGAQLVAALADPGKAGVLLLNDVALSDSDFSCLGLPLPRATNFTITGSQSSANPAIYPVLDLGFVKSKVRLEGGAVLKLERLVLRNFRATPLGQSPGFDLVASSTTEAGAMVLMQDSVMMLRICVPRTIQGEIMSSIPRPPGLPGTQVSLYNKTQANCTNNTSSAPVLRCWPDLGEYVDVAVAGFDIDAFGRATATRYTLYMVRVPYLCERQMTVECVAALGPLGCFLYM